MSIRGSPYGRFRRSLEIGRIALVYSAAAELPRLDLGDALEVLALMAREDPPRYPRAATRWVGRLALERPGLSLAELQLAAAACELLPMDAQLVNVLRGLSR